MSDQDKNKDSGRIKDSITGKDATPTKKKLVIKKGGAPQSKDISDLFNAKSSGADSKPAAKKTAVKPAATARPGTGPSRPDQGGSQFRDNRPRQDNRPPQQQGAAQRGGRPGGPYPGPGNRAPGGFNKPTQQQQQRPAGTGPSRPGGSGPVRQGPPQTGFTSGTPFDTALNTGKKPAAGGTPARRQFGKKPAASGGGPDRSRGGRHQENTARFFHKIEKKKPATATTVPTKIEILESIQVGELAKKLNLKPGDVIARLMKMGEMVTINKILDADTATLLAGEYGCEVKVVSLYEETVIEEEIDKPEDHVTRPPVVTIMGHVDHGKTKLLDTIRKTNIIATESGAITQHIGAYQAQTSLGKITFLDTPGHEAFTSMRARGAAITDIVVLVVAADDGVKEQTVEAITHAKEANVPIIIAINKVDLPAANPARVKKELTQYGLQSEDFGGSNIFCEISAKQNTGIEHLLEMILLQAEVMDLKANPKLRAVGRVVEAKIDPGKGPVATVLVQKGVLKEGDPYVVGVFSGRVRAMADDFGRKLTEAGPSMPVEISGIDGVPEAGDPFQVVVSDKYGREIANKRQHYKQITDAFQRVHPTLGDLKSWIQDHKELKVILKGDVQGSVEAIREGLAKLSTADVKVRVIHGATGAISESDVSLASASNAIIVGFHARPTPRAMELAQQERVEIKYYSIIYNVIEEIRAAMEGLLEPDRVEETTGRAEIRQVFKISKIGNVAGCMVITGKIKRNNKIRVLRNNVLLFTGNIKSLKRQKDEVGEVVEGFECGISVEGYNDIQVGDHLEGFEVKEIARKL